MSDTTFKIDSAAAARGFQSLLNDYYRRRLAIAPGAVPNDLFTSVYALARAGRADSRLPAAIVDFELSYLSMMRDVHGAAEVWAGRCGPANHEPASVLDDFNAFAGKLDVLHNMTSFALRCRAFWDKSMGILFLVYDESNYEKFARKKSRKGFFKERAGSWRSMSPDLLKSLNKVDVADLAAQPGLPDLAITPPRRPCSGSNPPFHEHLAQIIDTLDSVRTAEAHGPGTLRKWSLAMLPLHESKDAWLINHWNIATGFTHALRRTLLDLREPTGT